MVTVGKELSTHLYRETEYFSGYLWVFALVKSMLPVCRGEPIEMSPSAEAGMPLQGIHPSFIPGFFW